MHRFFSFLTEIPMRFLCNTIKFQFFQPFRFIKQNSRVQFKLHPGCSIALMS